MSATAEGVSETRSGGGRRRTAARLAAVQALYERDITGAPVTDVVRDILSRFQDPDSNEDQRAMVSPDGAHLRDLVEGVAREQDMLDEMIGAALSPEWPIDRLEVVLRAILRAGGYEMFSRSDIPPRVVISEYLDLTHAFFAGKEAALVNAVLDRLAHQLRADEL